MEGEKIALITGALGGIGKTLCQGFKKNGWTVIASDIFDKKSIEADYFINIDLDSLCYDHIYRKEKIDDIKKICSGRLDLLINNGALQIVSSIGNISLKDWQKTLNVNLTAPFILCTEMLNELTAAQGSVINISSIHEKLTKPNFLSYATSKSGLAGLTRSLAVEIGDKVRVNSISPGAISTKMLQDGFIDNPIGLDSLANFHPSKSIGTTTDVLDAALYLANGNKFVNGTDMTLDGGISSRLNDPV